MRQKEILDLACLLLYIRSKEYLQTCRPRVGQTKNFQEHHAVNCVLVYRLSISYYVLNFWLLAKSACREEVLLDLECGVNVQLLRQKVNN